MKFCDKIQTDVVKVYEATAVETVNLIYATGSEGAQFNVYAVKKGATTKVPLFPIALTLSQEARSSAVPLELKKGDQIWAGGDSSVFLIIS